MAMQGSRTVRQRDRQASTRALLEAGIEAFSTLGYDAATTREIAHRAGLNEQLITRYFGGKMGLLIAIYRDLVERQEDDRAYEASPLQSDPQSEMLHFLRHKQRHFHATRKLITIVVTRMLINPVEAAAHDTSFLGHINEVFVARMAAFRDTGSLRPDCDLKLLSEALIMHAFMRSIIQPAMTDSETDGIEEALSAFVNDLCQGIVAT